MSYFIFHSHRKEIVSSYVSLSFGRRDYEANAFACVRVGRLGDWERHARWEVESIQGHYLAAKLSCQGVARSRADMEVRPAPLEGQSSTARFAEILRVIEQRGKFRMQVTTRRVLLTGSTETSPTTLESSTPKIVWRLRPREASLIRLIDRSLTICSCKTYCCRI